MCMLDECVLDEGKDVKCVVIESEDIECMLDEGGGIVCRACACESDLHKITHIGVDGMGVGMGGASSHVESRQRRQSIGWK
jgi:hypothetical protein